MPKYFIITFGCQMNKSDSERVASALENIGYKPAQRETRADLIVVNMCSVRQSAVDRIYGLIQKLKNLKTKKQGLKTVLTGCMLKTDKNKFRKHFDLILDIKDLPKWPKLSSHIFYDRRKYRIRCRDYLKIKPRYSTNFLAFVPISNGCNNFCTYCVVPFVRGTLVCRDHDEILNEVKNVIKKGFREIWLLGQNVNDYRSPGSPQMNFSKLLKMVDKIEGNFKIFFTSPHPKPSTRAKLGAGLVPHPPPPTRGRGGAGNFSWDELIEVLAKSKKFGKYLNLPVQSGDDEILRKMNRNYTVKEYKNLVKKIREKIPGIKLSTDVIVGFPSETKKQFENTVKLFKEINFNMAYIAKYSPRPGTAAWQMKDNVPLVEKKQREKILRKLITQHGPR